MSALVGKQVALETITVAKKAIVESKAERKEGMTILITDAEECVVDEYADLCTE